MKDSNKTRIERFEKRRKSTKAITILLILGILLSIVLLWIIIFGGKEEDTNESTETNLAIEEKDNEEEVDANSDSTAENEELESRETDNEKGSENENDSSNESIKTEQVDPSDDNVIEAYTANWPTIPTEQTEPDILNFDKETQNRSEIEAAIRLATGLDESMVVWWLSNGGNQQVISTVSDRQETEIYRVYIQWHDGEGWQPFKVEQLQENDQKWRFE